MLKKEWLNYIEEIAEQHRNACRQDGSGTIIRDDIFPILNQRPKCIVLYYPLKEEHNKAFHVPRQIGKETYHIVYINTAHSKEKQAFAAAHELGHMLEIDHEVANCFHITLDETESEEVINRFAAEFMMPKEVFQKVADGKIIPKLKDGQIENAELIPIVVYLMNYFFQPYNAVIKRFAELGRIQKEAERRLIERNE